MFFCIYPQKSGMTVLAFCYYARERISPLQMQKKEKKKKKRKTQRALTRSKFSKFFILDLFARRFDKSGLEGVGGPLLTDVAVAI